MSPPNICRVRFLLATTVCIFLARFSVPASPVPATVEEQARAVLDKFTAAGKAKDADAVSRLLSKDCIIIMTEPAGVSARARFFTRDKYLELLKQRYAERAASNSKRVIRDISTSDTGDVFVTMDNEERARIGTRSEWIRSHEYVVMRQIGGNLVVTMVVAEMFFYAPDVPAEPTAEPKRNGTP
jgi:ketosteroid isomerase-like protein